MARLELNVLNMFTLHVHKPIQCINPILHYKNNTSFVGSLLIHKMGMGRGALIQGGGGLQIVHIYALAWSLDDYLEKEGVLNYSYSVNIGKVRYNWMDISEQRLHFDPQGFLTSTPRLHLQ